MRRLMNHQKATNEMIRTATIGATIAGMRVLEGIEGDLVDCELVAAALELVLEGALVVDAA